MEETFDFDNLDFHEQLGEGGYGTVNRVTFKKPFKGYTEAAAKSIRSFRIEEVEIMRKLIHPHILTLLAFYKKGPIYMIIIEYAKNGSLHDYLSDESKPLPEDLMNKWFHEIASAVQNLHGHNVLHRDLKPSNCLLFKDNIIKLCDFGLAREIVHSETTSTLKGTCRYMSPEIHKGNDKRRAVYSKPSDIYAYGMLLLEIYTRKPPFDGIEWQAVIYKVGHGEQPTIPEDCPQWLSQLMQCCWNLDPKRRPIIDDIIKGSSASLASTTAASETARQASPQHFFERVPQTEQPYKKVPTRQPQVLRVQPNNSTIITDRDLQDIIKQLTAAQLHTLYIELEIPYTEVERRDSIAVFRYWRQTSAPNATRETILNALETCEFRLAKLTLERKWN